MKNTFLPLLLGMAALAAACDDGRIYESDVVAAEEGRVVKLTARISGADTWPDNYNVVVAGFKSSSVYAVTSANIPTASADGVVQVVMGGVDNDVETIEVCAIDRLRRRVAAFSTLSPSPTTDTIRIDLPDTLDVSMYAAVQREVFSAHCAQCHGGSAHAGGGLYLTEGNSYASLVNRPSTKVDGALRVAPGNAAASVLHTALNDEVSNTWTIPHGDILVAYTDLLRLVDDWIDSGARR